MTTIAAASVNGVHALAADGRTTLGTDVVTERSPKLFSIEDGAQVVASAGGVANDQILESCHATHLTELVEELRQKYVAAGWKSEDGHTGAPIYGQEMFYLTAAGIWKIGIDLSIFKMEPPLPIAIGSGSDIAIGAIESLLVTKAAYEEQRLQEFAEQNVTYEASKPTARELVLHAVRVAIKRDAATGGEIMLALRGAETFGPEWVT